MLIGIAITLGFSAISASIFREMGGREYDHAYQTAANLVASISSNVDRNIELYDLSLQQVITAWSEPEIRKLDPEVRNLALFDGSAAARDLGPMQVLDDRGRVIVDSTKSTPDPSDFSGRDFFRVHQMNATAGLFISRPWITDHGMYLISLSRRISNPDGSFAGAVVGSIGLRYFHDLFRTLRLGPQDSIGLLATDGTVVMRYPFDIDMIGKNINASILFERFDREPIGHYRAVSKIDGLDKLFIYQQVGKRPLMVVQGASINEIFAGWWREIWLLGALLLVLSVLTLALILTLTTALKRRHAAETRLAIMASTDGLTGLNNRRHFDEVLDAEWRRALRAKSSLALIFIDVDHFKSYNDIFGHQAGDQALGTVANCIAEAAKRGGDLCARYGGEEFAILLPDADINGAVQVAEKIRMRVLALRTEYDASTNRVPTISLGVAAIVPQTGLSSADLVKSADLALYDAKRDGRNRTARASVLPFPQKKHPLAAAG
jgi:diguanylate cyclase (GGDEF)-like protein